MHGSLILELLLSSLCPCLGVLQLHLKFDCLQIAIRVGSLGISKLVSEVIDNLFLLGDLDPEFLFFTRHELLVVFHLASVKGTLFSISCFLVSHQLFKQSFKLSNYSFLLLDRVFIQSCLFVLLGQYTEFVTLLLECHLQVLMLRSYRLSLSQVCIGRLESFGELFVPEPLASISLRYLNDLCLQIVNRHTRDLL